MDDQVAALFERMNEESMHYVPPSTHQIDHLSDIIRTRILGVPPDSQDVELYDDDWRLILTALGGMRAGLP